MSVCACVSDCWVSSAAHLLVDDLQAVLLEMGAEPLSGAGRRVYEEGAGAALEHTHTHTQHRNTIRHKQRAQTLSYSRLLYPPAITSS